MIYKNFKKETNVSSEASKAPIFNKLLFDIKLCLMTSLVFSSLFRFSSHPIILIVVILIQALTLCIILWLIVNLRWFSYILFLVFLGGIIILFVYIRALASNEKFKFYSTRTLIQIIIIYFIPVYLILKIDNNFKKYNFISLNEIVFKLYSFIIIQITLITIIYLIITLIVIIKIIINYRGPLRSKN